MATHAWIEIAVAMVSALALQAWMADHADELGQLVCGLPTLLMAAFIALAAALAQLRQQSRAAEERAAEDAAAAALAPAVSRARSRVEAAAAKQAPPQPILELDSDASTNPWVYVEQLGEEISMIAREQQQAVHGQQFLDSGGLGFPASAQAHPHLAQVPLQVVSPDFADAEDVGEDVAEEMIAKEAVEILSEPSLPPPEEIEEEEIVEEADEQIEPLAEAAHPPPPFEDEEMEPVEELVDRLQLCKADSKADTKVKSEFLTGTGRAVMLPADGEQRAHEVLMIDEEEEELPGTDSSAPSSQATTARDEHEEKPAPLSVAAAAASSTKASYAFAETDESEEAHVGQLDTEEDEEMERKYSDEEEPLEEGDEEEEEEDEVEYAAPNVDGPVQDMAESSESEEDRHRPMIKRPILRGRATEQRGIRRPPPQARQIEVIDVEEEEEEEEEENDATGSASHHSEASADVAPSPPPTAFTSPKGRARRMSHTERLSRILYPPNPIRRRRGLKNRANRTQQLQQHGSPALRASAASAASPRSDRKRKRIVDECPWLSSEFTEESEEGRDAAMALQLEHDFAPGSVSYNLRPRRSSTSSAGAHSDGSDSTAPPPTSTATLAAAAAAAAAVAAPSLTGALLAGIDGPAPKKYRFSQFLADAMGAMGHFTRTVGAADARPRRHI